MRLLLACVLSGGWASFLAFGVDIPLLIEFPLVFFGALEISNTVNPPKGGPMARKFTYADVRPWKAVGTDGKTLRDESGKLLNTFKGYRDAQKAASKLGGQAVRA